MSGPHRPDRPHRPTRVDRTDRADQRPRPDPTAGSTGHLDPAGPRRRPGLSGRLGETVGSWRAALRIARREARRARGRTALVLAMIALPVLALSFVAVTYDMADLTRVEQFDQRLGAADVEVRWVAENPLHQDPWGEANWAREGEQVTRERPVSRAAVEALLPPGSRASQVSWWVPFEVRIGDRTITLDGRALDLTDPLPRSTVRLRSGRVPAASDEVAVSEQAARRLGVRVGGTVAAADGSGRWRVVGVVEFPDQLGEVVALTPGGLARVSRDSYDNSWLVDLPGVPDAALVERLNAHGVTIGARTPVPSGQPSDTQEPRAALPDPVAASNTVLVGGLGLLEVVLLVGPAFAVGVRRRRRDLALVAVAGGDPVHLRRIVLADGVVLGGLGAALGLLLGVTTAFTARPLVEVYVLGERSGGYRVFPAALAAIAAVAVLAGVLAALAPALTAARQDVVAGLAGRRAAPPHRRRWLFLGVLLTALGTGAAFLGAGRSNTPLILTGLILGELGLVFATPTLIGLLARLGRLLPPAPRIALRDASRNRSSAAPAISAVMAAVAGSVALGVYVASDDARNRAEWQPALPPGRVLLWRADRDGTGPLPPLPLVTERVRAELGPAAVLPLAVPGCVDEDPDGYCSVTPVLPPERTCPYDGESYRTAAVRRQALADPRCVPLARTMSGPYLPTLVDDGTALGVISGAPRDELVAATAVLRAGGAVVTDPRYLADGRVVVRVERSTGGSSPPKATTTTLPGYLLRGGLPVDRLVLSPAAADRAGLTAQPIGFAVDTPVAPAPAQIDRAVTALRPVLPVSAEVERGPPASEQRPVLLLLAVAAGVITVGAAGVATGLAAAEGRRDLSTLAAVGASPRVRRVLSLCQAGVIAVVGSVLGIAAGLASALIILTSVNRQYAAAWPVQLPYPMVVPWQTLGVLVVVPLVAMLGAGLFTRSRLAVERRLD
ncbi:putative ABC transport system permease protein [Micromonospora matsumotoense]|uniref:Putative ABC transport system permease protein n=1 Tax=Micromonospora matsumotoense TaxID=121616 RepID=A0A1C4YJH8_9ACTN|nr:FtsX-like permease family protein [Micromonospora matsumotoense]SCF20912.1 putative ABC transport system permease protein [Micromonospora matsumotoense]